MFCESWRETLSGAAVRGEGLSGEAEAHLAACGACRSALAAERALFGLIENGLRAVADAEVPASLVPRVRERIAAAPAGAAWRVPAFALAAAVLAIVGVALSRGTWKRFPPAQGAVAAPEVASTAIDRAAEVPVKDAQRQQQSMPSKGNDLAPRAAAHAQPEVLVSPEEEIGLQRYADFLRTRGAANATAAVVKSDAASEIEPLEIVELDVRELSIEPLEGDH